VSSELASRRSTFSIGEIARTSGSLCGRAYCRGRRARPSQRWMVERIAFTQAGLERGGRRLERRPSGSVVRYGVVPVTEAVTFTP